MTRGLLHSCCATVLLAGCSVAVVQPPAPPAPKVEINEVIIRNQLPFPITAVQIFSPASNDFVSCGNIFQKSHCSTTFPPRSYNENPVEISWKERGVQRSMAPFAMDIPQGFRFGRPASIEVTIFAAGQAGAKLIQQASD